MRLGRWGGGGGKGQMMKGSLLKLREDGIRKYFLRIVWNDGKPRMTMAGPRNLASVLIRGTIYLNLETFFLFRLEPLRGAIEKRSGAEEGGGLS